MRIGWITWLTIFKSYHRFVNGVLTLAQSQVFWNLELFFLQDCPVLITNYLPYNQPVTAEEKLPHTVILPSPCVSIRMVCPLCVFIHTNGSNVIFSGRGTICYMLALCLKWFLQTFKWNSWCLYFNKSILFAIVKARFMTTWQIALLFTNSPTLSMDIFNSFMASLGLFMVYQCSFLSVWVE